ncbi:MAG: hypothetical protein M3P37_09605 [Actinomycetota bacterium]|nr:hypothetical protein [Actinomycetota bacterium]
MHGMLVLPHDRRYLIALDMTHRVDAATRQLAVLELPTEKFAVKALAPSTSLVDRSTQQKVPGV